ncbi:MAG: energy transducer TonB family protein [Salibacteraceae bacterium]
MPKLSLKYWAILITAAIHVGMFIWFATSHIQFDPDKQWTQVRMAFQEEEIKIPIEKEVVDIPENYEEKGTTQRKYSVAKTNEAVNEAMDQISKGEQARIEQEIDAQINQMAKDASTTGFLEANNNSKQNSDIPVSTTKKIKSNKKSGDTKGTSEKGNSHNMATNISYYLKDRVVGPIGLYNPVYLCQTGGKVVVNIVVNSAGQVISASINDAKSETKNSCLRDAAKKAALKSSFNEDVSASAKQRGIITYKFVTQ